MPADTQAAEPQQGLILSLRLVLLTCALAALGATLLLSPHFTGFEDRIIGITLLRDANPYFRNNLYILSILACLCLSTALFLRPAATAGSPAPAAENTHWLLAACLAGNALLALRTNDNLFWQAGGLCLAVLAIYQLCRRLDLEQAFPDLLTGSWQAATVIALYSGGDRPVLFWLCWAGLVCLPLAVQRLQPERMRSLCARPWWSAGQYLVLLAPLFFIGANELRYTLASRFDLALAHELLFAAQVLLAGLWWYLAGRPARPTVSFAALCVLITSVIINQYSADIAYRSYDLFHLGERVVPLQQLADFGALPFIDYLPVHGLFDLFPHLLYQWLNDATPLESLIWGNGYFLGWLMRGLAVLVLFSLLSRLLDPRGAFLMLWLLPSYHLVQPYYTPLLLPALHLLLLPEDHRAQRRWWLRQWSLTLLLALWRPDFGVATTAGNLVLATLRAWPERDWRGWLAACVSGVLLALVTVLVYRLTVGGADFANQLSLLTRYLSAQVLVVSYEHFYEEVNYLFVLQFLLLPLASCLVAGYSAAQLLRARSWSSAQLLDLLILFLTAVGLIISLRSLHRHSLVEGQFKPYFHLLVLLLFLLRLPHWPAARWRLPLLAGFVALTFALLPRPEHNLMNAGFRHQPAWEYPFPLTGRPLPRWTDSTRRLDDQAQKMHLASEVLRASLQPGETLYDFSNGPMLYALAGVELPVFVMETIYQSSDSIQRATVAQLDRWYRQQRLPLVVFRRNSQWDALDGVDNALRSYLIAEYLYPRFTPCARIGKFDLWLDRRQGSSNSCERRPGKALNLPPKLAREVEPLPYNYLEQFVELDQVPVLWATLDEVAEQFSAVLPMPPAKSEDGGTRLGPARFDNPCTLRPCYLDLDIQSSIAQRAEISFAGAPQMALGLRPGRHRYRIRISLFWHWSRRESLDNLQLRAAAPHTVNTATLRVLADADSGGA